MNICRSCRNKLVNELRYVLSCSGKPSGHVRSYATEISASRLKFGQALHETHPHLIEAGNLTPGISALEYAQRRTRLAKKLPRGAIAILAANDVKYRSGAVFWPFHQDSNFFYLTGFNETQAVAVIGKSEDDEDHVFRLFLRPKNAKEESWEGTRSGLDAATDVFNADETGDIAQLRNLLPPLISEASEIYADIPFLSAPNTSVFSRVLASLRSDSKSKDANDLLSFHKVKPLKSLVHDLRIVKSTSEIELMRKIGKATGRSFQDAMRQGSWRTERELMAYTQWRFVVNGCDGSAYVPIVAGGENALVKHYTRNDDIFRDGEMIFVDAGGEIGHYVTDITRTWPLRGKFTAAQKDLYDAVLSAQRSCVSLCRVSSNVSLDKLHSIAQAGLVDNLKGLGFDLSGNAIDVLFPHHVGHYIGLDVHDTPGYSLTTPLREGMCITVEPGIHVPIVGDERFPAAFRGMSVQIEDSVAIGAEHPTVLSVEAPKEIDDIEALCRDASI